MEAKIDLECVWDTYKYRHKLSVSTFQVKVIQNYEVKSDQTEIFGFGWCDKCFLPFLVKSTRNNRKTVLKRPNSDKIQKSGLRGIP